VVDTFPSISETFISTKAEQLSRRGHKVIVFCVKRNRQLLQDLFGATPDVKVVLLNKTKLVLYLVSHPLVCVHAFFKEKDLRPYLLKKFRLSLIEAQKPDIIHFEFSGIGIDYLYEIERLSCKKVVSCRGSAEKIKLLIYEERKKKFIQLMQGIDAVHCVSQDMVNTIRSYCRQQEKIFVNFPSIDTNFFYRKKNKTRSAGKIILSVGRMTFQKGYTNALLAIKLLKASGVRFTWVIVGNGNKYEEIIFKLHQLKLENEVMLMGAKSREQVRGLMEEADIFFLPSVYEGIANVVLEAMAMELPVVATRSGGMAEVIDHETDGLLTEVHDYAAMANCLERLCNDEAFCNHLGRNARRKITRCFNIETQITKFEKVYKALKSNGHLLSTQDATA
jgi:colanic acid/amylovoran biosynthesis glycosyltransferase